MKGLAEVLAEHEGRFHATIADREWMWRCTCGAYGRAISPRPDEAVHRMHRAHVEAAVLDWVRERLAGAWEDVVLAINAGVHWDTGALDSAPAGVLAAVAEALGVGEVRG